MVINLKWICI